MNARRFTKEEDARYVRCIRASLDDRTVLAKIVKGGSIDFSTPLTSMVPILLKKRWQIVRPRKKGHRRLRHELRVVK